MLLSLKSICKNIEQDSIKISINDVRLINKVFADYDRQLETNIKLTKIKTISYNYIKNSNDTYNLMNSHINNLHKIVDITNDSYKEEIKSLKRQIKRQKIKNSIIGTTGIIIIILIL